MGPRQGTVNVPPSLTRTLGSCPPSQEKEREGEDEDEPGRGASKGCIREVSRFSRKERAQSSIPFALWAQRWATQPQSLCVSASDSVTSVPSGCHFSFKVFKERPFAEIPAQLRGITETSWADKVDPSCLRGSPPILAPPASLWVSGGRAWGWGKEDTWHDLCSAS